MLNQSSYFVLYDFFETNRLVISSGGPIAGKNRKLVQKISDSVRFARFLFPYMQNKFDFCMKNMSLFRFNMSLFFGKKRLKSFYGSSAKNGCGRGGSRGRGCHMALPYGLAIWLCHTALPYGSAIWPCHIARSDEPKLRFFLQSKFNLREYARKLNFVRAHSLALLCRVQPETLSGAPERSDFGFGGAEPPDQYSSFGP